MTEEKQETLEEQLENLLTSPDIPEKEKATVNQIMTQLQDMKIAGAQMSRRQAIRMIGVGFYILFLCFILYMNIGNTSMVYSFIFCVIGVIICLDDLSLAKKLRRIEKGEVD